MILSGVTERVIDQILLNITMDTTMVFGFLNYIIQYVMELKYLLGLLGQVFQ